MSDDQSMRVRDVTKEYDRRRDREAQRQEQQRQAKQQMDRRR